jgi:hypothetical protein
MHGVHGREFSQSGRIAANQIIGCGGVIPRGPDALM